MEQFDLIIVGSGSGNAIPEEMKDWRIALVEKGTFGGTCLNVGCIPSKMFVIPADIAISAQRGSRLGVNTHFESANWPEIRDRVFGRIDPISQAGEEYRASGEGNVELIAGTAKFLSPLELSVGDRTISAPKILLAAGSRPTSPDIKGLSGVEFHTSDSIMRLNKLPERLVVIGGGFIAAEMAHVFSGLGSNVTLINRSDRLLRNEDSEVSQCFTELFDERVDLRLGQIPTSVTQSGETIQVEVGGETLEADQLLIATGRTPNSDLLETDKAGIDLDGSGRISVNSYMESSTPGIWAVGDIANKYQLKHVANAEAKVAFANILGAGTKKEIDYSAVPHAVFSSPQIASVGLTEQDAIARENSGGEGFVVGKRDYAGTAYGWALEDSSSFAKVVVDSSSGKILGAHIIGPQAATLIQPLIQAIQFGQTAKSVAQDVYYIHPALSEVVENALLSAVEQLDA